MTMREIKKIEFKSWFEKK